MANQQSPSDEVKVKQYQTYWDEINKKHVPVESTVRVQSYDKATFDALTKPDKDLGGKSRLEYAGYRFEVIKEKAAPVAPPVA